MNYFKTYILLSILIGFSIFPEPFKDMGNGTIKDEFHSLTWQKCSAGQEGETCEKGYGTYLKWKDAIKYCSELKLVDKKWRLPNINELMSIIDYNLYKPAINLTGFPNTRSLIYWTSTIDANNSKKAWILFFNDGSSKTWNTETTNYVRCVSGN